MVLTNYFLRNSAWYQEVYSGRDSSFALTQEGKVVKWGHMGSFELIKELNNIVLISVYGDSFVAVNENGEFFYLNSSNEYCPCVSEIAVTNHLSPKEPFCDSFVLIGDCLFVIDIYGDLWQFNKGGNDAFNDEATTVVGLTSIVSIGGCESNYAAIDNNG
ncbi:hypothetical protein P9112_009510 [Eukaryota sp. TZLM1-RC]